jgi:HK97 family phage major capsid protein/HK97 family phage prohead protease
MSKIKTERFYRSAVVGLVGQDKDDRTIELAFSSEEPVERYFGQEVLDHTPTSLRLGRLNDTGALLVDHNPSDLVGKVEQVTLGSDRIGRAVVRFGNSVRAQEVYQDVIDGIRTGVSVGYQIHRLEEEKTEDVSIFRATDWEPMEISLVSIPADASVGVGRSSNESIETEIKYLKRSSKMSEETTVIKPEAPKVDIEAIKSEARTAEVQRIQEITAIGEQFSKGDLARQSIESGRSVNDVRKLVLDLLPKQQPVAQSAPDNLDLEPKEKRSYSMFRAITASVTGDWTKAGLEREASHEISKRVGKEPRGFFVPSDISWSQRDMTIGSATAGGNLKGTDHMANEFIDALRPKLVLGQMGARFMSGLQGDVAIPALNAKTSTYFVAESGAPTEGAPTVRQVTMSPKTVGAYVDISRKLMIQSDPSAEQLFRDDMVQQVASAMDTAGIQGSGSSNQPTGILNTSGIGSVAIGTNGGIPSWASIVNLVKEVSQDNGLGANMWYLTNPQVVGKLRQTAKVGSTDSQMIMNELNTLLGYRVMETSNVSSTLTKGSTSGSCSAMIFGNFAELIIGEWSGVDVLVDPYTGSSTGVTRVTVFKDFDIAVRHAESFASVQDYTTT